MAPGERHSRKRSWSRLKKYRAPNSLCHSQAHRNQWLSIREAIHNGDAKKPTFRSKCLLNPSGTGAGMGAAGVAERGRVKLRIWLLVLLLMCQPAMAGQRILLIRGLMDYVPGVSPMSLLKSRLTD